MMPKNDSRMGRACGAWLVTRGSYYESRTTSHVSRTTRPHHYSCAIRSDLRYVPWVRRWVGACVAEAGADLSVRGVWRCTLVLMEAVNNAMVHAHRRRPEAWVELEIILAPRRVTMTVTDTGPPFTVPPHRRPRVTRASGRGWYLMRTLCRQVTVRRHGGKNRVRMIYDDIG